MDLAEKIESFQNALIDHATGGAGDPLAYELGREEIVNNPLLKDVAPRFLRTCRNPGQFWSFIKAKFPHYVQRSEYLREEFEPIYERLEGAKSTPADSCVSSVLQSFNAEGVHAVWTKALDRRNTDPEGAITLARTLLETVCKHILEEYESAYKSDSDLPGLYKMAARQLKIAPSQQSEPLFQQILGGCTAVVEGLGAMRNRLSDAHGQGKKPVKPAARHAELAVNLAGAMATFLVATHQARTSAPPSN